MFTTQQIVIISTKTPIFFNPFFLQHGKVNDIKAY